MVLQTTTAADADLVSPTGILKSKNGRILARWRFQPLTPGRLIFQFSRFKTATFSGCRIEPARESKTLYGTGTTRKNAYCTAPEISNLAVTVPLVPGISCATVCQLAML